MEKSKYKHSRNTIDMSDEYLCSFNESEKLIIVEASDLQARRIFGWQSSNNIYHMIRLYSSKSKKNYTFIHSDSDVIRDNENELVATVYKSDSSNGKDVSGWELHVLND